MKLSQLGALMCAGAVGLALSSTPARGEAVLSISNPSVREGNSGTVNLPFVITRRDDLTRRMQLQLRTEDGSAVAPADYVSLSSANLNLADGIRSSRFDITVNGDSLQEGDEFFFLRVASAAFTGPAIRFGKVHNFSPGPITPVDGHRPDSVVLGDLNGDGRLDMVVANSASVNPSIGVLLNTTSPGALNPSFTTPLNLAAAGSVGGVALGDINKDGRPDVVAAVGAVSELNRVVIWLNTTVPGSTTASFGSPVNFQVGCQAAYVVLGDLNGDGDLDVVAACSVNSLVAILINTTPAGANTPSFVTGAVVDFDMGVISPALADLNGDGRLDLTLIGFPERSPPVVLAALNTTAPGAASASFGEVRSVAVGDFPKDLAAGDLNGDGRPDIAVTIAKDVGTNNANPRDGRISVLLNTTAPGATVASFSGPHEFFAGFNYDAVALDDLNADGKPDLVVSNALEECRAILNRTAPGANTLDLEDAGGTALGPSSVRHAAVGDLNNDGKPDVVMPDYDPSRDTVHVLLNTTVLTMDAPTFSNAGTFASGFNPVGVAAGDFNGDGRLDLVSANPGGNNVSILLGTAAPGATAPVFSGASNFATGDGPAALALGDVNGDGRPDLITANQNANSASVLLNTGAVGATVARFTNAADFAVGNAPSAVTLTDLNGDGRSDLAVANSGSNNVSVLFNTGAAGAAAPGFATASSFAVGNTPRSMTSADFNNDGRNDLATANRNSGTVSVLLNTAAPGATAPAFAGASNFSAGSGPASVAAADFNKDGKTDLAVADSGGNSVTVLFNTTAFGAAAASFVAAGSFATTGSPAALVVSDFNNDGKPDIAVTNTAGDLLSVLLNTAAPGADVANFASIGNPGAGAGSRAIAAADVNNDGLPDLLAAGSNGISVSLNQLYTVTVEGGRGTILNDDVMSASPSEGSLGDQAAVSPSATATRETTAGGSLTLLNILVGFLVGLVKRKSNVRTVKNS